MNRPYAIGICLSIVFTIQSEGRLGADEPASSKIPAGPEAAQLNELTLEYQRLSKLRQEAIESSAEGEADGRKPADENLSDEEWLKAGREIDSKFIDPEAEMLPRFLKFARSHPNSPCGLDALFLIIRLGGPQTGDVHGQRWKLKEESLDVVWKFHADDPRLCIILEQLGGALPSHKTEAFLKRALNEGSHTATKAAAAYNLARYYLTLDRAHDQSRRIKQKSQLVNYERFWKIVVTPYLETHFPLNEEQNSGEIDRLLRLAADRYSEVPATDWKLAGPGGIFVELTPHPKAKSYGDLSRALLFERNNMVPGKPAPEIEGTDADGKHFRLSDYKGKVVLLVFSANWCGGCVALHPIQRKIVEKYRGHPFVMLGVSRDGTVDTLKADTASAEITWRCWWDGMHGPIHEAWNDTRIPRIVLLDHHHKFVDVDFSPFATQDEFEQAIDALLENVPESSASEVVRLGFAATGD